MGNGELNHKFSVLVQVILLVTFQRLIPYNRFGKTIENMQQLCNTEGQKVDGERLALDTRISNSYNMDTRALAHLLHEGAKRPRAINKVSARASML